MVWPDVDSPGNVNGEFSNGNPVAGVESTIVDAEFLNMLLKEMKLLLNAGAIAPDRANNGQMAEAVVSIVGAQTNVLVNYFYTFTAGPGGTSANQAILVGNIFGVVVIPASSGNTSTMWVLGRRNVPKVSGEDWTTEGQLVWWDDVAKACSIVKATGRYPVGCVAVAAGTGTGTALVRLNGVAVEPA